jgi:hypothetical protein
MHVKEGVHVFFENRLVAAKPQCRQFLRTNLFLDEPRAHAHVHGGFRDAISSMGLKVFCGQNGSKRPFSLDRHGAKNPFSD